MRALFPSDRQLRRSCVPVDPRDFTHLAMPAEGEGRARRFYCDFLGLREIPKPPNPASHKGVWFECGTLQLHLGVAPELPARTGHPTLALHDLRQRVYRLLRAGFEAGFVTPLSSGTARAYAVDPFGNRLELIQAPRLATDSPH